MKKIERTIKEILDCKTGLTVTTDTFFENHSQDDLKGLRFELQEAYKNRIPSIFKCCECYELLRLRGGRDVREGKKYNTRLHFAHYNDTKGIDCNQKTGIKQLSVLEINRKKYRGQQEGEEHYRLKFFIAESLKNNKEVSNILIDKYWKGGNDERFKYKYPDVRCIYKEMNIVFEIQLSTTYLSVIEERQWFYKNNKAFILWVFNQFNDNDDTRRFTDNDVIFSNNLNAFVLDDEAVTKSRENNKLIFKCYFRTFSIEDEKLMSSWNMQWVDGLENLTFDLDNYKVFLVDVSSEKIKIEKELEKILSIKKKESNKLKRRIDNQRRLKNLLEKKEIVEERIREIERQKKAFIDLQSVQIKKHEVIEYVWNYLNSLPTNVPQGLLSNIFIPMFMELKKMYDSNNLERNRSLVKEKIANYICTYIDDKVNDLSRYSYNSDKVLNELTTINEKLAKLNHKS
jgi:adenylate kinase